MLSSQLILIQDHGIFFLKLVAYCLDPNLLLHFYYSKTILFFPKLLFYLLSYLVSEVKEIINSHKSIDILVTIKIWIKEKEPHMKRQECSARKPKLKILIAIKPMI